MTDWTPKANEVPTEVQLWVDGKQLDSSKEIYSSIEDEVYVKMTAADWADFIKAHVKEAAGDIVRVHLNHGNGRITVDMENVYFEQSVELKLLSGRKLLTTAKLNTANVPAGEHSELTGNICLSGSSSSWQTNPWTPLDDVVPTEVQLWVDGKLIDSHSEIYSSIAGEVYIKMTAEDWANFPGTQVPSVVITPSVVILSPTADTIVEVPVGEQAKLRIVAQNAEKYQWYIDRGNGRFVSVGEDNAIYTSSPVEWDNSGYRYYCEVTGSNGSVARSHMFTLKVVEPVAAPTLPKTGDDTPIALIMALMLLSLASLTTCRKTKRHHG